MPKIKRGKTPHPNQPKQIHKDKKNEVVPREIKIFREWEVKEGNTTNHIRIWICQWSGNQSAGGEMMESPVQLEKRRLHYNKDGTIRWNKAMGWNKDDLTYLTTIWGEISKLI